MIKQSYTFEELLPYLKPTEKYQFDLWDLEESDFYYHLKSDSSNIDHSKFGELIGDRIQEYPILQSYCTDTVVGEHVYVMDGVVAWSTYQSGRKCDINFEIHSNEKYLELLALARSCFFDSDEERDYKDCDMGEITNMVFVYEYADQAITNDGIYAFMDDQCFIRKVIKKMRHPSEYFGSVITYIDGDGKEVTQTLDKSNGRMVGFKFHNADFITDNFINKSIEDFIENREIKTQFGEVKWSFKDAK